VVVAISLVSRAAVKEMVLQRCPDALVGLIFGVRLPTTPHGKRVEIRSGFVADGVKPDDARMQRSVCRLMNMGNLWSFHRSSSGG